MITIRATLKILIMIRIAASLEVAEYVYDYDSSGHGKSTVNHKRDYRSKEGQTALTLVRIGCVCYPWKL